MTSGGAPIVKANSQIPSHTENPDSSQPKTHFVAMGKFMMNNMVKAEQELIIESTES